MTQAGYDKLKKELSDALSQRPVISAAIAEAREKGDLSENAEYDAARDAQGLLEVRIARLKDKLANARVIDESKLSTDSVQLLSKVTVRNLQNKMEMNNVIVTDPMDPRLEYVKGSYSGAGIATYDEAANNVTFAFDSITDETVIEFDARVRDGAVFENNGSFYIENEAFKFCDSLTSISLPSTLEKIGNSCFWGCTSLTSITIPENVTELKALTFANDKALQTIYIPEGCKIPGGEYPFSACNLNLQIIRY